MDVRMDLPWVLSLDDPDATLANVGGKGMSLARLARAGLPVPAGFHVTTAAYRRFVAENDLQPQLLAALEQVDAAQLATLEKAAQTIARLFAQAQVPGDIASAVVHAYAALPGTDPAVAVRSSATAEDLPEASFAGQQETYLNVSGAVAVLEATRKCWASLWTARAIGYRTRQGLLADGVALAVVVQLLVPAEAAGILFTANPLDGRRDQAVVNAAWGLGEAVVGGTVTPDTLIVDKATGQVVRYETAEKQVMIVCTAAGTAEQAVPAALRQAPVLNGAQAAELARYGVQIEALYERPMDIEWALADGRFAIVQARPVTALPEPASSAPIEWKLPDPKGQYMRASIIELLPDPLSPLFATLGMSAIEQGIDIMAQSLLNMPKDALAGFMLTIEGYAYQKVSFTRRQWWLLLTRMFPAMPRMMREGGDYWRNVALPHYRQTVAQWSGKSLPEMAAGELLSGVRELMVAFAMHLASLMASTMGPSAGSEGLFTQVYEKMVRREGDPAAPVFLLGYDSIPIQAEKALYDLALWVREDETLAAYLAGTPSERLAAQLASTEAPGGVSAAAWAEWRRRFGDYLDHYGYSIYDMDVAKALPRDEPAPILETLKLFLSGQGKNPHERQQAWAERREQAVQAVRARLKGLKRWAFDKTLRWAQSQAPLREDGIAEIGLGYPVLRWLLLELGRRFSAAGAVRRPDDVFWLEQAEVEAAVAALERGEPLADKAAAVQQRQALWRARKRVTPPAQLPRGKKYMGFDFESTLAGGRGEEGNTIKGVPTSPGRVTATARVLHGPDDFGQMRPGDVLVASITTPAWTPLFALAAGVVTDVGGPLSHSSIVAREYGVPAVLGTGVATKRIRSGQVITVDGGAGTVTLEEEH